MGELQLWGGIRYFAKEGVTASIDEAGRRLEYNIHPSILNSYHLLDMNHGIL